MSAWARAGECVDGQRIDVGPSWDSRSFGRRCVSAHAAPLPQGVSLVMFRMMLPPVIPGALGCAARLISQPCRPVHGGRGACRYPPMFYGGQAFMPHSARRAAPRPTWKRTSCAHRWCECVTGLRSAAGHPTRLQAASDGWSDGRCPGRAKCERGSA
jgi:hypothetical protein